MFTGACATCTPVKPDIHAYRQPARRTHGRLDAELHPKLAETLNPIRPYHPLNSKPYALDFSYIHGNLETALAAPTPPPPKKKNKNKKTLSLTHIKPFTIGARPTSKNISAPEPPGSTPNLARSRSTEAPRLQESIRPSEARNPEL